MQDAMDQKTWEIVAQVQIINRSGHVFIRQPSGYTIGYRSVELQHELTGTVEAEWFAGGYLRLLHGEQKESPSYALSNCWRNAWTVNRSIYQTQVRYFATPRGIVARLIEACGLKGCSIGGAMVSPKHANFIVNTGNATATDIEALILMVQVE